MKAILDNNEVILDYGMYAVNKPNLKEGDLTEHKKSVKGITLFYCHHHNNFIKVQLDKKMILELAEKIKQIESEVTIEKYYLDDDLPF